MLKPCVSCDSYEKRGGACAGNDKACRKYSKFLKAQNAYMKRRRIESRNAINKARMGIPIPQEEINLMNRTGHNSMKNEDGLMIVQRLPTTQQIEDKARQLIRGSRNVFSPDSPDYIPGTNAACVEFAIGLLGNAPVDFKSYDEISDRFLMFLQYCIEKDRRPNLAGWILALGIDRQGFTRIMSGRAMNQVTPETFDLLRRCRTVLETLHEEAMTEGSVPQIVGIFLAKANYGYKDNPEAELPAQEDNTHKSTEEIKKKYADLE